MGQPRIAHRLALGAGSVLEGGGNRRTRVALLMTCGHVRHAGPQERVRMEAPGSVMHAGIDPAMGGCYRVVAISEGREAE